MTDKKYTVVVENTQTSEQVTKNVSDIELDQIQTKIQFNNDYKHLRIVRMTPITN